MKLKNRTCLSCQSTFDARSSKQVYCGLWCLAKSHFTPAGDGCWLWRGAKTELGYGFLTVSRGKQVGAHRFVYENMVAKIPDGMHLLHKCDNPTCINPGHMRVGSHADNMHDMFSKGRNKVGPGFSYLRGAKHPMAKLSETDVTAIRNAPGEKSKALASRYGVSVWTIQNIRAGRNWSRSFDKVTAKK